MAEKGDAAKGGANTKLDLKLLGGLPVDGLPAPEKGRAALSD